MGVAGGDDDLEYYVRECGDILGVSSKLVLHQRSAKHVLQHVFLHVVHCKKLNQAGATMRPVILQCVVITLLGVTFAQ